MYADLRLRIGKRLALATMSLPQQLRVLDGRSTLPGHRQLSAVYE